MIGTHPVGAGEMGQGYQPPPEQYSPGLINKSAQNGLGKTQGLLICDGGTIEEPAKSTIENLIEDHRDLLETAAQSNTPAGKKARELLEQYGGAE